MSDHHATRQDAIRIVGASERTFSRLEGAGIIAPLRRGRGGRPSLYDLTALVPAYVEYVRKSGATTDDRAARARRDLAQAELTELRTSELKKAVLPREQVVREGVATITAVRAKLLVLPGRLVQAGHIPPEKRGAVDALIREALEEMAAWKTLLDLRRATRASENEARPRKTTGARKPAREKGVHDGHDPKQ